MNKIKTLITLITLGICFICSATHIDAQQVDENVSTGWVLFTDAEAATHDCPVISENGSFWARGSNCRVSAFTSDHAAFATDSTAFFDTAIADDSTTTGFKIWTKESAGVFQDVISISGSWVIELAAGGIGSPGSFGIIDAHLGYGSTATPLGFQYSISQAARTKSTGNPWNAVIVNALTHFAGVDQSTAQAISNSIVLSEGIGRFSGSSGASNLGIGSGSSYYFETSSGSIFVDWADGGLTSNSTVATTHIIGMTGFISLS